MKRSLSLLSLACLALLALHCKPEPIDVTPCFTVVADTFRDPREPVVFVNCSAGADSYFWQFGDGTTSTEASPAHTFAQVGTYDVRLTASLGDAQEIFIRRIRVDYPRFRKVRVLEMPVLNPANGLPWDSDGSGLDLIYGVTRGGESVATPGEIVYDVALPFDFLVPDNQSIATDSWWEFELYAGSPSFDTATYRTLYLADLIDSPIEAFSWDSTTIEIIMEGVQ